MPGYPELSRGPVWRQKNISLQLSLTLSDASLAKSA